MSVDTKVRLKGYVKPEDILNVIRQKIDNNAIMEKIRVSDYGAKNDMSFIKETYDGHPNCLTYCTSFIFEYEGNRRSVFYLYSNCNAYENLEYYSKFGLTDMVKSETTQLICGCFGSSEIFMKIIVDEFGGWIDYNDCDDISYEPVVKNADGTIKPVIRVTMKDIYEKFGGIVIIEES